MRKLAIIILNFFLIFCLLNCGNKYSSELNPFINVNIDDSETRNVNLSELVESCEIILLENKPEALLNRANGFAISKDYILITDFDQNPAKLFTRNGLYVQNVGKIGVGPDEYSTVGSPYIDEKNNSFWLLLGGNYQNPKDGWYYVFNKKGELIQKISTLVQDENVPNSNRLLVHDNHVLIPGNVKSKYILVYKSLFDNQDLKIQNRINQNYFTYTTNRSTLYPLNDSFIFKIGEVDTIYSFTPNTGLIKPISVIFTKKHRFDETKIKDARSTKGPGRFANIQAATENCYSITLLGETDNYYLFSVEIAGTEPSTKLLLVNKFTGQKCFTLLKNDFTAGLVLTKIPYFYHNKYVIFHYSAIGLLHDIESRLKEISDQKDISLLQEIKRRLTAEDNDILMICKLRL